jgi:hypothetical protein
LSIAAGASGASFDRLVGALGAHGRDPKVRGHELTARCPLPAHTHGDRNPSLSAKWDGSRVLLICHACGSDATPDVVAAVGLTMVDLWDEPLRRQDGAADQSRRRRRVGEGLPDGRVKARSTTTSSKRDHRKTAGTIVARYDYPAADGARLHRVLRYEPKSFRQSHWNGHRWVTGGVPAEQRVLFGLPAVRAAAEAGDVVWVAEGEKDALALQQAGLVATTNPGGAAAKPGDSKWLPQYVDQLAGARVVVVADRDDAGARHALVVRDSLRAGGVEVLRVVEAAEGKDAHDHLVAHGRPVEAFVVVPDGELEQRAGLFDAPADLDPEAGEGGADGDGTVVPFPVQGEGPNVRPKFGVNAGELVRWKQTKDGFWQPHTVLGCEARIVRIERSQLDESESPRTLRVIVAWSRPGGEEEELVIPAEDWNRETWLGELPPDIYYSSTKAGIGDVHRAIGAVSGPDVPRPVALGALGWQELEEHGWCYVHAGGAISATGTVPIITDFGGDMAKMGLPDPSTDRAVIREAAQHSLSLVDELPAHIGATVTALPFRTVLSRLDWVGLFRGTPGTGKTSVANLAMSHLSPGRAFNDSTFTLTGTGTTANAPQEVFFRYRDSMALADDAAPDRGEHEAAVRLAEVIRTQANHVGKQRMGRAGELRRTRPPRGTLLITSEVPPATESARQRTWEVRFAKGDVDHATLLRLHDPAAKQARALLMASYIQWLAGRRAWALDKLERERHRCAEIARHQGVDVRVAAAWAELAAGWSLMLMFLVDVEALTEDEMAAWWAKAWDGLEACADTQRDADMVTDLGKRWLGLFADTLTRGGGHLCTRTGDPIEDGDLALAAGWAPVTDRLLSFDDGPAPVLMKSGGPRLGVLVDDDEKDRRAWIVPSAVMAAVRDLAAKAGRPLEANEDMIREALGQIGVLRPEIETTRSGRTKTRLVVKRRMLGGRPRVWDLAWDALWNDDPPVLGFTPEPPAVHREAPAAPEPAPGALDNVTELADRRADPDLGLENGTDMATEILPADQAQPCVSCGHPARTVIDGHVVHPSDTCIAAIPAPPAPTAPPAPAAPAGPTRSTPSPRPPASTPPEPTAPPARSRVAPASWRAPAAVVDDTRMWLPAGEFLDLPETVVDLAGLVAFGADLGLGHGGGRAGAPAEGQLWLTAAALERFGLPAELALEGEGPDPDGARRDAALDALTDTPPVVGLRAAGWQLGNGGRLDTWTKVWTEDNRRGLRLVMVPWHNDRAIPLIADDPAPPALADRLARLADLVGITYRVTPAVTGLDLMHAARPTSGRGAGAITRAVQLPDVARASGLEGDLIWHRSLGADETSKAWVHAWDRNGSYLAVTSSLNLGLDVDPTFHRDGTRFDPKVPGYWRVPVWDWDHERCPDPAGRGRAMASANGPMTRWVTTPVLELMVATFGLEPEVTEAWLWDQPGAAARYLAPWNTRLRDARKELLGELAAHPEDHEAAVLLATVKDLYKMAVGKLARQRDEGSPRWRPDWRHHIQAAARANIIRRIWAIGTTANVWPVVANTDALYYVSDDPDPHTAWPGKPEDLADGLGRWKVVGSAPLDTWASRLDTPRLRLVDAQDGLVAPEDR